MIGPSKKVFDLSSEDQQEPRLQPSPTQQGNAIVLEEIGSHDHYQNNQQYQETYQQQEYFEERSHEKSFRDLGIPTQSFAILQGHTRGISCVAVEPKGHRMATGGLDYHVRLWDFHGMNKNLNSFRIVEPFSGNAIRNISFNTTGSHLMIINGGKQITFLDRDGARNMLTVKGYMYVKQLYGTKGHTNTIHDGQCHPINHNQFVSASGDGSIRLWDLEQKLEGIEQELAHKTLLKCKDSKSVMCGITAVTYTMDGKFVIGGCLDGSIQIFSTKNNLHRPQMTVRDAHKPMEDFSSIVAHQDCFTFGSRNTDGTLKIWDMRKFSKPMVHYSHLPNTFPGSKMCYSPDYRYLLAGTSIGRESDEKEAYLHFFDATSMQKLKTINMGPAAVTGVTWNREINQIVVGLSSGETRIYFDQKLSLRGALKSINKQPRVDKDPKFDYSAPVYLPHSLPIYKERPTNNIKKDLLNLRKDPILTAKPYMPVQGPFKNGRRNELAYTQVQHMIQSLSANPEKVDDARKPLWQIQKYVQEQKQFTSAYQHTQPNPVFHQAPVQEKQFNYLSGLDVKICPHCGLKLCTCVNNRVYVESDSEDEDQKKKR